MADREDTALRHGYVSHPAGSNPASAIHTHTLSVNGEDVGVIP